MSEKHVCVVPALEGYANWLGELKSRIHSAQQQGALALNHELIQLYWQIGHDMLQRQAEQGWGAKVIERLSHGLRPVFPEMKGLSRTKLMYICSFAGAWPAAAILQQVVGQLPWRHNLVLLTRMKQPECCLTYARRAVERDKTQPIGVTECRMIEFLPDELQTSLPSIEQIERKLGGEHD